MENIEREANEKISKSKSRKQISLQMEQSEYYKNTNAMDNWHTSYPSPERKNRCLNQHLYTVISGLMYHMLSRIRLITITNIYFFNSVTKYFQIDIKNYFYLVFYTLYTICTKIISITNARDKIRHSFHVRWLDDRRWVSVNELSTDGCNVNNSRERTCRLNTIFS